MPPLTAARAVMAAKATALAGAALAGLWLGLLIYVLPSWSLLAAAQSDGITGIIGLVGRGVMVGGALYLEHCCQAPESAGLTATIGRGASRQARGIGDLREQPRRSTCARPANSRWAATYSALPAAVSMRTGR